MSSPARSISQRATERVMAAPGFRRASRRLPVRDSGFPTESRSMQGHVERRSRRATCSPSAAAQNPASRVGWRPAKPSTGGVIKRPTDLPREGGLEGLTRDARSRNTFLLTNRLL